MNNYETALRICVAILIGGILGYERESKHRPAGLRTHILVCVGSAVVSMIQVNIIADTFDLITKYPILADILKTDMGRLGAQVISGIGFLGVGTIIQEKGAVKGLTTAASIWITACIGLAVGMGYYFLSFTALIGVYTVIVCAKRLETNFFERIKTVTIEIQYYSKGDINGDIIRYFKVRNLKVKEVAYAIGAEELKGPFKKCYYTILVSKRTNLVRIEKDLDKFQQIVKATII